MAKRTYYIAAIIAIGATIPFLLIASEFWFADENAVDGLNILGAYAIFLLGIPLTLIPMEIDLGLTFRGQFFTHVILFITQWIFCSQFIALFLVKLRASKNL
jgi:hypothetical protein